MNAPEGNVILLRKWSLESTMLSLRAALIATSALLLSASTQPSPMATRHYAPNRNFDAAGQFAPGEFGFNMSDVMNRRELVRLPDGVLGLVWVGQCDGADEKFIATLTPFLHHPKVFGFYLMDDPDPRWWRGHHCSAEHLKDEADWIRTHAPNTKTFIMLMNMGSSRVPTFAGSYNPGNTHVDLFGLAPYPCRTEAGKCDYKMIDRFVEAAVAAGIPVDRIVPAFQTFGGGTWTDDEGGQYAVPTAHDETEILARWATLIEKPVFDYAYSWGSQRSDTALENSAVLRSILADHNLSVGIAAPPGTGRAPP